MISTPSGVRRPGATYAVSNTGPLIAAFQSESFALLTALFAEIHLPPACQAELEAHGYGPQVQAAAPQLVLVPLTPSEIQRAGRIAQQIAHHSATRDPMAAHHRGEAQAIVLARRPAYRNDLLLLDELAARAVAQHQGVKLSGFPGVLLLAVQGGLISADELKARLERCRAQGTHYGVRFIHRV